MQDRKKFETYLKKGYWNKADEWLYEELCFLHNKVIRQRIVYHSFGVIMSLVMAFFTWVVLFPSADEKELKAFPLTTICNNLFNMLCKAIPGGKAVAVIGLILIPCLVALILALAFSRYKSKTYPNSIQNTAKKKTAKHVEEKLKMLSGEYGKYDGEYPMLILYALFAGVFTGGVMVFSSTYGGLNPFEYIFVGIICDIVYGLIFFGCICPVYWLRDRMGVQSYPTYDWGKIVEKTTGEYTYSKSEREPSLYYQEKFNEYYAMYTGTEYETPEERAKRIAIEIEEELSGKGYGDY